MARNRKRAKARARRPAADSSARPATATAGFDAPDPIQHASPDVELAEAQLALGRPEQPAQPEAEAEAELNEEELEREELESEQELDPIQRAELEEMDEEEGDDEEAGAGGELAAAGTPAARPAHREHHRNRLINFIQGSWHELQRVQWPDRRQVMQATGVVIGFVIVAGVFLGVADLLAGKLVTYILK